MQDRPGEGGGLSGVSCDYGRNRFVEADAIERGQ
jgi:hypothetical protein